MKLGVALPTGMPIGLTRRLFFDWARLADEAGFHVLGAIDKPSDDTWEPLSALAAAAAVTERILLAPTILQLPNRNEVLVAKQCAVIDRLTEGRFVLGVGQGGDRAADYETFGASLHGRGDRLGEQVERIRAIWSAAARSTFAHPILGPAPEREHSLPIWIGARTQKAVRRALDLADGLILTTLGPEKMSELVPELRQRAHSAGKRNFVISGLAYVAVGCPTEDLLAEAAAHVARHYGRPPHEFARLIHTGDGEAIREVVNEYDDAGLDLLVVVPQVCDLDQLERLAEDVLPNYLAA